MKKLMLVALALLLGFSAKAQFYAGGQVGLSFGSSATSVRILPEVGYTLNDKMSVGAVVGYDLYDDKDWLTTDHTITLAPYFRYTFLNLGPVRVFADAQLNFNYGIYVDKSIDPAQTNSGVFFEGGIAPGIAIPLSDNLSLVAHIGRLGYYEGAFKLDVDGNALAFGLYYSF